MKLWRALSDESGQMAFTMLIAVFAVFVITALAFDAGLWYFDHRDAQSDSEAAALAAAGMLPATDTDRSAGPGEQVPRRQRKPGSDGRELPDERRWHAHPVRPARRLDGQLSTVTVCVRRQAPGFFAALSGIPFVHVSAASTALAGPADGSNVMPWAVVAPDPNCDAGGQDVQVARLRRRWRGHALQDAANPRRMPVRAATQHASIRSSGVTVATRASSGLCGAGGSRLPRLP